MVSRANSPTNGLPKCLDMVGIPSAKDRLGDYPHQFSGGNAPARDDRYVFDLYTAGVDC